MKSLPSRERGLKYYYSMKAISPFCRSLHGSVDWNTIRPAACFEVPMSLPSRERGLKLKCLCYHMKLDNVAPFTGAWIEICTFSYSKAVCRVAPLTGAWIEIEVLRDHINTLGRRSLHGSVDWNIHIVQWFKSNLCRTLHSRKLFYTEEHWLIFKKVYLIYSLHLYSKTNHLFCTDLKS